MGATKLTKVKLTCLRDGNESFNVEIKDESGAVAKGYCPHCGQRRKVIMLTSTSQFTHLWVTVEGRYRRMTIY